MSDSQRALKADFCIAIDFQRGAGDASRVFRTMTELIGAFEQVDRSLVRAFDTQIEPVLILEDVETASLKAWLSTVLKSVPDESIEGLEWKRVVGQYLKRAKYIILNWTEGKATITDRHEVLELRRELRELAETTEVNQISAYAEIEPRQLMTDLQRIGDAVKMLAAGDRARYETSEGSVGFNAEFTIAPHTLEELLTRETIVNTERTILQVKRPDYLGEAQWELRYSGRTVNVRIEDKAWLQRFQAREVDVRPGDGLRVDLRVEVAYGHDNDVVATHYAAIAILEVIPPSMPRQGSLLGGPDDPL